MPLRRAQVRLRPVQFSETSQLSHAYPDYSLYTRRLTAVTMDDGTVVQASTYFYNAPLGRAERIASGDYLEYLRGS